MFYGCGIEILIPIITILEWFGAFKFHLVKILFLLSVPFYFIMQKTEPLNIPNKPSLLFMFFGSGPSLIIGTAFSFFLKLPLYIKARKLHDVASVSEPYRVYGKFWGYYATNVASKIANVVKPLFYIMKFLLAISVLLKL